jgi:hypothetical protein
MKGVNICFKKFICNSGIAPPTRGRGWGGANLLRILHPTTYNNIPNPMKNALSFFLCLLLLSGSSLFSQDDLLNQLDASSGPEINYTTATFKSTRIVNGQSIERMKAKQLDFRISHRFGLISDGAYELWGLDQSNVHFSLEYGVNDWLMFGVGRGTYEKAFDGFTKVSLLRQSTGAVNMPVSVSLFGSAALNSVKFTETARNNYFSSRMAYSYQLLVGRKFGPRFSAQLSPTVVHRNLVPTEMDPNDTYAVGMGGRMKLTSRLSLNAEYYYVINPLNNYRTETTYNPLAIGIDLETGGHVFQLMFTNSLAMVEKGFITETTGQWRKGDIHFGFNISRVFSFKKAVNEEK